MKIKKIAKAVLPTLWGKFIIIGFEELKTGKDHIALVYGDLKKKN